MLFPIRASLSQAGRSPFCSPGSSGAQHGVQSGKAPGSPPDACPARPPGRSAPAAPAPPWDSRDGEGKGTSSTRPRCPFSGWILSLAPCGRRAPERRPRLLQEAEGGRGRAGRRRPTAGAAPMGAPGTAHPHRASQREAKTRTPASHPALTRPRPGLFLCEVPARDRPPRTLEPPAPRAPRPEVVLRPLALRPPLTGCSARPSVPSPPSSPPLGTVGNSGDDSCSSGHCHQVLRIFRAAAQGTGRAILRPISFPPRESAKKQCKNSLP